MRILVDVSKLPKPYLPPTESCDIGWNKEENIPQDIRPLNRLAPGAGLGVWTKKTKKSGPRKPAMLGVNHIPKKKRREELEEMVGQRSRPWGGMEQIQLAYLYRTGMMDVPQLAKMLFRPQADVIEKLVYMGLMPGKEKK